MFLEYDRIPTLLGVVFIILEINEYTLEQNQEKFLCTEEDTD